MYKPVVVRPVPADLLQKTKQLYYDLCLTYISCEPTLYTGYVASAIANDATIDRHIRAFELYAPYILPDMKVLDWGCRHAPDSCMLRYLYKHIDLHGCDVEGGDFSVFYDFAKLKFKKLEHVWNLPYEDGSFDTVISSGALEHVAIESKSIQEIWRILRNDGIFIVTFLPNSYSITENIARLFNSYGGHNRLYHLNRTRDMFLRSGFVIEDYGFHQVFPTFGKLTHGNRFTNTVAGFLSRLNRFLEKLPPINIISSNIYFVLRRSHGM